MFWLLLFVSLFVFVFVVFCFVLFFVCLFVLGGVYSATQYASRTHGVTDFAKTAALMAMFPWISDFDI